MGPISLEAFIMNNEIDLNNTNVRAPKYHNISKEQKLALKDLQNNTVIIIKQADMGGATVVIDRER